MFQSLIDEFRQEYQQRIVIYEEFSNILEQFAKLDKRCQLDDSTKSQIYTLLQEKQQVTYQAIEILIFEFLIQQPLEQEELRIDYDNLGPFASKLPKDMIESITPEFLQQFTNFFKLISNKLGQCADWLEIEKLGRDVQRQSKVNTIELLRYIQPFVDGQRKVLVKDLLCLINDLERLQIGQSRVYAQIGENQNQFKEKDKEMKDSSSDDEKKQTERKDLANTIYQQADYLGRKYVKPEGQKLIGEICKAVQTLEQQQRWMEQELEEKNKKMEEMNIQRELVQGALNQFDYDIKQKDQQMEQLLYDLDQMQAQLYQKMDQNDELVKKLENYNEELKQVSKYESEVRIKEIELKRAIEQNNTFQKEIERITLNNKSLLQIIKELEQQEKEEQQTIIKTETVIEYDDTEIKELQDKVNQLQDYQMKMEQINSQQEKQMIDLQRELTHYKGLYENIFKENNQLRCSLMPRNSIRSSVLPNNTNRCSTLKIPFGNANTHLSFIGRTSSTRYSSIKGNTGTIHSNFNPLDDLRQSNQLRIEEADDADEQNPDQIMPPTIHIRQPPPRFDSKFQSSQLNQIKEEDDQEDQTIIQQDRISDNNDKNKNKMMWDLSAFLNNQNINEQDPKFYEFDENIIYATDFLGIREEKKIAEILKLERRTNNAIIQRCFSDSVYRIDHKGKKSRRIIFITEFNVYIFEGETKPQKITRQFPIQNIHTIIFSESSPVLCSIQIAGSDDYLIETFKRSEFNTYLTEIFGNRKFKLYQLDFRLNFKVKFKGQKEPIPIEQIQQRQGYLDHGKMSAYKVSSNKGSYSTNIGWLQLYSKKVFHNNWQEIFVLLTNVGLIIFKKPGDMEPILFISLVDALVIKNPITEYNKPHILKIRYETSQLEFHFSASSSTLLDQWHDLIQQVIMEQVKQQNKQLEQQQSDIVKQRTQTLIEQNNDITN